MVHVDQRRDEPKRPAADRSLRAGVSVLSFWIRQIAAVMKSLGRWRRLALAVAGAAFVPPPRAS
jgi:hypothetical protein